MNNCTEPRIGSLLPSYELHLLTPEETEQFEIHMLICAYCTNSLRQSQPTYEMLKSDQRLKRVIQQLSSGEKSLTSRFLDSWWPPLPLILRPAVFAVLALLAICSTIYLAVQKEPSRLTAVTPEHIDTTNQTKQASDQQTSEAFPSKVQLLEIATLRGTQNQFNVTKNESLVLSFASELSVDGHKLSLLLLGNNRDTLFRASPFTFDNQARGQILLPAALVQTGTYRIVIQTLPDSANAENEFIDFSVTTE